jgi:hypothetical protein
MGSGQIAAVLLQHIGVDAPGFSMPAVAAVETLLKRAKLVRLAARRMEGRLP